MKKFVKILTAISIAAVMLCLISMPDKYVSIASEGIKLWALSVLPSLFPFFFLTLLLTKIGAINNFAKSAGKFSERFFRCNGISIYVFLMSILSGYPIGAKLISELYECGKIGKDEATRMSTFCSTSGPLFIVGTVGVGMFGNKTYGFIMLFSHVISAVICGKIFYKFGDFKKSYISLKPTANSDNILYECVYSSVISILCVGGFICVFYLLSAIMNDFYIMYPLKLLLNFIFGFSDNPNIISDGICFGIIECTNGCRILSADSSALTAALGCALISFGGISIMFQSIIYLSKAKVNLKIFVLSKILQMISSFIVCFFTIYIFNII